MTTHEQLMLPFEELITKERDSLEKSLFDTLNTIPIDDQNRKKLVDIVLCFYDQHHSEYTSMYTISSIFYFLQKDSSLDDIEFMLFTKYIDDADVDEETLIQQRILVNNIKTLITKIRDMLYDNTQYRRFYISLIKNLLKYRTIYTYITFEDENWIEKDIEDPTYKYFQHKEFSNVLKIVDLKTDKTSIYQLDYYIFSDQLNNTYTCKESAVDISDCYSWGVDHTDIDIKQVQKFINHYNERGIMFEQAHYLNSSTDE